MQEAVKLFEAVNNPNAIILAKHGLGSIYLSSGNWEKAIEHIEPLIPQMRESYRRPLAYALSELAFAQSKKGEYNQAIQYLNEADTTFDHSRDIPTLLKFLECSAEVYEVKGNYKKALFYQKWRKESQDNLNQNLNNATSAENTARTELNEKIAQLEILATKSKSKAKIKIWIFSLSSALLAFFLAFCFYRKKKKQAAEKLSLVQKHLKDKTKLAEQKTEIELTWNEPVVDISEPSENELFVRLFTQKVQNRISDRNLTVESLAEGMKISRVALYKRVKSATNGNSPSELIRAIRLETGKRLLESKKLSVYEVATSVGFTNAGNFSRSFKSHFGISPSSILSKESQG